ncbi:MAG: 50S ribosomal protein L24 [Alphaproteobacteria bacterium]
MAGMKIKKGDTVVVLSGKDKGKTGEVIRAIPTENKVVVEGINIAKRHTRPTMVNPEGGIKNFEAPIHVSNVAIADPKDGKATRVGYTFLNDGRKVRVAKRSGETIDG